MAGNPFLAMSEEFSAGPENPALNPFLTGDFGGGADMSADNPFAASNPFSDFGATDFSAVAVTTAADFFGVAETVATTAANFFSTTINDGYDQGSEPLFSTAPTVNVNVNIVSSNNFFDTTIHDSQPHMHPTSTPAIQKPTDLDLTMTHTVGGVDDSAQSYLSDDESSKPSRPPMPSRPIATETKNLILSVTGHMEQTSSHLLDRIPPTRTPSPVSMRDLHSPSPTPDHGFGDFLGDPSEARKDGSGHDDMNLFDMDDIEPDYGLSTQQTQSISPADITLIATQVPVVNKPDNANLMNAIPSREVSPKEETPFCDVNQNKPPRPGLPPARPNPPSRPARPLPPQKPPPPTVIPSRPPPFVPHAPPPVPPPPAAKEEFSFFDAPVVSQVPTKSTNQDILNLYATPKKQEERTKQVDFLTDDIAEPEPEPKIETQISAPAPEAQLNDPMPPIFEKPQPMDITPCTEDIPLPEQMAVDPITDVAAEEISSVVSEIQQTIQATPEDIQLSFTSVQPIPSEGSPFESELTPAMSESSFTAQTPFGGMMTDDHIIKSPASSTATESNPFSMQDISTTAVGHDMFGNVGEAEMPEPVNIFGLQNTNSGFDPQPVAADTFGGGGDFSNDGFGSIQPAEPPASQFPASSGDDAFDAFSAKFESTANKDAVFDAFGSSAASVVADDAWGNSATGVSAASAFGDPVAGTGGDGFGGEDNFDSFLTLSQPPPVPSGTPAPFGRNDSAESEEGNFNVFIKPREGDVPFDASSFGGAVPVLAPPPARSPAQALHTQDASPRLNPFDKSADFAEAAFGKHQEMVDQEGDEPGMKRTDSQETPPTPLFDDDVSQPLEEFPRIHYEGPGWEVQLRQPNKKKITGQRFWKKIFVKLAYQGDNPVVQLYNSQNDKEPFQELPLQACYSVSDIAAQQYDQYGKIFTIKLQYIFYKERPGVRPGQVTKAERITNKLSQFAAYAIQGDYQGVKEFGSDLKKLGLPVEHAPQISQLFKIGSTTFEDMKQFSMCIEEALFRLNAHRDRALHYKLEEVQITAVDELYVEQDAEGHILKQIARVRLFFLGFLSGMPDVELGVNDMWRQGKEVVGRHDIIPVATEEWIRLECVEFHSCVQPEEYTRTRIIRFKPPDACYIELMRFRIRPPKNRELPLQLKAVMCVTGNKVELRADALVPGFTSRSLGQVPCEDVMIRFPIPECWIYLFRVEKHFRYGSVKSAHRRTGKIKGIERFLGAVDTLQESLIEVTSGQAKYEHQHRSIVWRMARLPKEGQGAYTTHNLVCRMALTSYDQIPEKLAEWCYVEFTMPATQASHTTVRSVSMQNHDSDEPPEKYVRYLARHEYKVGIEHTQGDGPNAYSAATISKPIREEPVKEEVAPAPAPPSSDSESD